MDIALYKFEPGPFYLSWLNNPIPKTLMSHSRSTFPYPKALSSRVFLRLR